MVCKKCGSNVGHNAAFCDKCGQPVKRSAGRTERRILESALPWEEKHLAGLLATLIGAVVGGIILYQFIHSSGAYWLMTIGGLILSVLTMGTYWRVGKRLSWVGILTSVLLMLFTGWLADWIVWVEWYSYTHSLSDFWMASAGVASYLYNDPTQSAAYVFGLLFLYEGSVIGSAVILVLHARAARD